jgi:prepilin signal peptidase PulO-like enzyme (type II secretory pathway)
MIFKYFKSHNKDILTKNLFVFIFGLIIGSFLNCVIYRLEIGKNFLEGRSYCPHCKHTLSWKDLIPLLSFLILKGKCRYCQQKISLQYPLVELSSAILFLFPVYAKLYNFVDLIFYWIIFSFLIIIFVFDLKHFLIPDQVIYPAIFFALLYQFFKIWNFGHWNLIEIWNLVLGILPSLFFLALILISRETWMGFGDFYLSILIGIFLSWPKVLVALFLAFFIGAIFGLILIFLKKKTLKSKIPFAPFLIFSTFFTFFSGEKILDWYFQFVFK